MDQDKLLEELRAQRDLLEKHLAWLDRKIAECRAPDGKDAPEPSSIDAPEADDSRPRDRDPETPTPSESVDAKKEPSEAPNQEIDRELTRYHNASGDPVLRSKIGCLLLFALGTALFLFLLFGLPYLID